MIKVMIIEDEPAAALVLQRMIEKAEDYEVVSVCGTFSQAVAEYLACSAQVCFVDIDLDGESGLVCAKAITEINPGVKIIFATAHNEFMADAFEIYAFDYLVKPFDGARVLPYIRNILSYSVHKCNPILQNSAAGCPVGNYSWLRPRSAMILSAMLLGIST